MPQPSWIDLAGADNVRDLAGLPTRTGEHVQPRRLIRADSLQALSDADVRHLVDDLGVRAVADLRTGVELRGEGPGPMTREPTVTIEHLSLFPEVGENTDAAAIDSDADAPVILPWQARDAAQDVTADERRRGVAGVYLRYLDERPDSILGALRLIASTDGATIVHCAAGKDRTGIVVAFALTEVGVERPAIVADYAVSADRVPAVYRRLSTRRTYANDVGPKLDDEAMAKHKPRAVSMERTLQAVDDLYGGVPAWLRREGWTEADATALRHRLLH